MVSATTAPRGRNARRRTSRWRPPALLADADVYHDLASDVRDDPAGLDSCRRALREGDVLVVWKLDRVGRNLARLVDNRAGPVSARCGQRVLAGDRASIDTTTAAGRLV